MSSEATNRIIDPFRERKRVIDFLVGEKMKQDAKGRRGKARYLFLKETGKWVDNACSRCHKGMSRWLVDRQLENDRTMKTLICSTCSKKDDIKALKELDRE